LVAGQRPARVPGARGVTDRRPVREPRVWPARRRARASGPPASHAARGRRALARGPRHRELRGARLVLVSLHAGAQRPPARPGIATAGRRGVRGLGRAGEWVWVRGRYGEGTRTVIAGPTYVLDVVELESRTDHLLELPWHFVGTGQVAGGTWVAGELVDEFVSRVERFVPDHAGPVVLELADGPAQLKTYLVFDGELLRAEGPGRPRTGRATFYLVRATGRGSRCITVREPLGDAGLVPGVRAHGGVSEVHTVQ